MSTWTSKAALLAAAFLLAGCATLPGPSRNAPTAIRLPDGMVVAGTRGWCVDRSTLKVDDRAAVVMLGSCAALARDARQPHPVLSGVITVSVEAGAEAIPATNELKAFFRSPEGRAALARDGRATSVNILEMRTSGDTLFIHAKDKSAPRAASGDYWRALFDIDGRIVSVSLVGVGMPALPSPGGFATLDAHVRRLISAN
jgi:hypothetical protein